jgi:transposase
MYSQFCYYIQQNEQKRRATMHIPRKPGQKIEVDWAGDPAEIIDPYTGETTSAWIFVGVITYSQYAFVEAFINEQQKAWITAALRNEQFFSLEELNTAIRKKLKKYNNAPFKKKEGSRQ